MQGGIKSITSLQIWRVICVVSRDSYLHKSIYTLLLSLVPVYGYSMGILWVFYGYLGPCMEYGCSIGNMRIGGGNEGMEFWDGYWNMLIWG
jgi:hypothetical protein